LYRIFAISTRPRPAHLDQLPQKPADKAQRALNRLGIDADGVHLDGQRIASKTGIWSAGVAALPASTWLPSQHLRTTTSLCPQLHPLPYSKDAMSQHLTTGGRQGPFRYLEKGNRTTLGRSSASVDLKGFPYSGLPVHICDLIGLRNRLIALFAVGLDIYLSQRPGVHSDHNRNRARMTCSGPSSGSSTDETLFERRACYLHESDRRDLASPLRGNTSFATREEEEHTMTTRAAPTQRQFEMIEGQPHLQQQSHEIQAENQVRSLPLGMSAETVGQSITILNQLLADSTTLYHLYKKHHWQVAGPTFYALHQLFDKHAREILASIDLIGERTQILGGVSVGMPFDVVERTHIERPPTGIEDVPVMLARTVHAHTTILLTIREGIEVTERNKDYSTNDLLLSDLLRMHEMQIWFVSQHLIDTPLMGTDQRHGTG
jgi:starvation-inducible DNA-binding protein